jgi:hypothetical protein
MVLGRAARRIGSDPSFVDVMTREEATGRRRDA